MWQFLLFWAWFVIPVIVIFLAVSEESLAWAALLSVLTVGAWWMFSILTLPWLWANLGTILVGVVIYVLLGTVWGGVKWWFKCKDALKKFKAEDEANAKEKWAKDKSDAQWTGQTYQDFTHYWYRVPLWASENKERITIWVFYWPLSILSTFFGDYLLRAVKAFIKWVASLYQRISDHVFKDLNP